MPTSTTDLELRIKAATEGLASVQSLADEIDVLGGNSAELRAEASKLSADLALLGRQQAVIDNFKSTAEASDKAAAALAELQAKAEAAGSKQAALNGNLETLRGGLDQTRTRTEALRSELQQSGVTVAELTARFGKNSEIVSQAKAAYKEIGKAVTDSANAEKDLEKAIRSDEAALATVTTTVERLTAEVAQSESEQRKHADALTQAGKAAEYAGVNTSDLTAEQQRVTRETANAKSATVELSNKLQDEKAALADTKAKADEAASSSKKLGDEQKTAGEKAKSFSADLSTGLKVLAGFAGITIGKQLITDLIDIADQAKNIDARLRIAAGGSEAFAQAQKDVLEIALQTGTKLESAANLYGRLAIAIKATGGEAADAAIATRAISESFAISGASADSANAAIVQLAQGLASGTLRGDELNSVLEQAPRLAQAFADSLGISTGELRKMGQEGALTPQILLDALKEQAPKIAAEFETIPVTVGRAMTNLSTQLTVAVGHIDATTNSSTALADTLAGLGPKIEPSLKIVGGTFETVFGGIRATFNLVQIAMGEFAAAILSWAGDVNAAMAAVTFGDLSKGFAQTAENLKTTSSEIKARVSQDFADIHDAGDLVRQGAGLMADGFANVGDAAQTAGKSAAGAADGIGAAGDAAAGAADKIASAADPLERLASGAKTAEETLGKIFASIKPDSAQTLIDAAGALQQMAEQGKASADVIGTQLAGAINKLSDADLVKLKATATDVLGGINTETEDGKARFEQMGAIVDALRIEQFARLGVDAGAVLDGIDAKTGKLLDTFRNLVSDPAADPKLITAAFKELLATVDSRQELDSLKTALGDVKLVGVDAVDAIAKKFATLPAAEQEVTNGINLATQGVKDLATAFDERIAKEKEAALAARAAGEDTKSTIDSVASSYDGLRESIGNAGTADELKTLRSSVNEAFKQGIISADQYKTLLEQIKSTTRELNDENVVITATWEQYGAATQKAKDQLAALYQGYTVGAEAINAKNREALAIGARSQEQVTTSTALMKELAKASFDAGDGLYFAGYHGAQSLEEVINKADSAIGRFDLLDDQQLSGLRSAIDSARQKLQGLRDDASSTLLSLSEELAGLQGDTVKQAQLQAQARVDDLRGKLAAAQATGDREAIARYAEALETLGKINNINIDKAKDEAAAAAAAIQKAYDDAVTGAKSAVSGAANEISKLDRIVTNLANPELSGQWKSLQRAIGGAAEQINHLLNTKGSTTAQIEAATNRYKELLEEMNDLEMNPIVRPLIKMSPAVPFRDGITNMEDLLTDATSADYPVTVDASNARAQIEQLQRAIEELQAKQQAGLIDPAHAAALSAALKRQIAQLSGDSPSAADQIAALKSATGYQDSPAAQAVQAQAAANAQAHATAVNDALHPVIQALADAVRSQKDAVAALLTKKIGEQAITINLPGSGSAQVSATSTEAAKLQALLQELERQAGAST